MDQTPKPKSVLESLGGEIIGIIIPVSICMIIVVALVILLNTNASSSSSPPYASTIATMAYTETTSDSSWNKFKGALLNSMAFVTVVTLVTFLMVLLFYLRFTKFLKLYMGFSAFTVLAFLGGQIALFMITDFRLPVDSITFFILLYNFAVVGVSAVFMSRMPIFVMQSYLVVIGVLVAYWFTLLPEWTTWVLLIAMSVYDLGAVLLPGGPLRLLVELAISRDEDIPALVYETRPVAPTNNAVQRRVWRQLECTRLAVEEESELSEPLIVPEGLGLGSSGAIKLGLGDFIFYSVLVGRAAMYDLMTVYACYVAIIAGLGVTLGLLAFYQKALPALPVSVLLGVLFYVLTRNLLEVFVMQCFVNLLLF